MTISGVERRSRRDFLLIRDENQVTALHRDRGEFIESTIARRESRRKCFYQSRVEFIFPEVFEIYEEPFNKSSGYLQLTLNRDNPKVFVLMDGIPAIIVNPLELDSVPRGLCLAFRAGRDYRIYREDVLARILGDSSIQHLSEGGIVTIEMVRKLKR